MKRNLLLLVQLAAFCISTAITHNAHAVYVDMGDGTVYDEGRSLLWQKSDDGVKRNFVYAESYCDELTLGKSGDWELPAVETLSSLIDNNYSPTINPVFAAQSSKYFSSTIKVQSGASLLITGSPDGSAHATAPSPLIVMVDFSDGSITETSNDGMLANGYIRCVIVGYKPPPEFVKPIMFLLLKSEKL